MPKPRSKWRDTSASAALAWRMSIACVEPSNYAAHTSLECGPGRSILQPRPNSQWPGKTQSPGGGVFRTEGAHECTDGSTETSGVQGFPRWRQQRRGPDRRSFPLWRPNSYASASGLDPSWARLQWFCLSVAEFSPHLHLQSPIALSDGIRGSLRASSNLNGSGRPTGRWLTRSSEPAGPG